MDIDQTREEQNHFDGYNQDSIVVKGIEYIVDDSVDDDEEDDDDGCEEYMSSSYSPSEAESTPMPLPRPSSPSPLPQPQPQPQPARSQTQSKLSKTFIEDLLEEDLSPEALKELELLSRHTTFETLSAKHGQTFRHLLSLCQGFQDIINSKSSIPPTTGTSASNNQEFSSTGLIMYEKEKPWSRGGNNPLFINTGILFQYCIMYRFKDIPGYEQFFIHGNRRDMKTIENFSIYRSLGCQGYANWFYTRLCDLCPEHPEKTTTTTATNGTDCNTYTFRGAYLEIAKEVNHIYVAIKYNHGDDPLVKDLVLSSSSSSSLEKEDLESIRTNKPCAQITCLLRYFSSRTEEIRLPNRELKPLTDFIWSCLQHHEV
ncbi:hypothetical protein H4219_003987 [Mycoemilia scoparia]|uniref:Uncharacterized protein n=1 Tax=Mycoemilia scoparia TaxID=417184 RepID=A0A9W7ZTJ7_9FUNG|nr:hypothetical protein H4219_003987 [Mycoemilia scoparia]